MILVLVSKENPYLVAVPDDFNAKLIQWRNKESSTPEGISVKSILLQFGLHQIINGSTHILKNSSLCIGLIFTFQPNLSFESGTQPSLHPNCCHQIIYAKFNLKDIYPPPYTHKVWRDQDQDSSVDLIRGFINEFDWGRAFANKHVHEKFRFSIKLS